MLRVAGRALGGHSCDRLREGYWTRSRCVPIRVASRWRVKITRRRIIICPTSEGTGLAERVVALRDQGEELVAGFFLSAEGAEHGAGDGTGMLFFYPAHHHSEVAGFADDADSARLQNALQGLGDLTSEPLL